MQMDSEVMFMERWRKQIEIRDAKVIGLVTQ
jgi:hypothetical protein